MDLLPIIDKDPGEKAVNTTATVTLSLSPKSDDKEETTE